MPPAMPSSALAASGSPAASSPSALRILSSASPVEMNSWKPGFAVSSSQYSGRDWMNSTISRHTGPAENRTSAKTATASPANTASAARPRFQPRRTSAPTIGSSPSASTVAMKIESSVPSATTASSTSVPNASRTSSVRTPTTTSTRCAGGR